MTELSLDMWDRKRIEDLTEAIRGNQGTKAYGGGANNPEISYKAAAILAGAPGPGARPFDYGEALKGAQFDERTGTGWLTALANWKTDPEANHFVKSVLGTSSATGQAIIPNNFVAQISAQVAALSPWRNIIAFESVPTGTGVDIPYDGTAIAAALKQGAFGSNKDVRDFSFGEATATFVTLAQIADVGNQLLRQSGGAAERTVRRRLAESFAQAESNYIINGTGASQPLGILQAFLAYGDVAANKYTLNSESRVAAIANGLGKLEARGRQATAIVMHPTDYWEMVTETLGTSGAGGWALDPTAPAEGAPTTNIWGVPIYRDANLTVGTAIAGDFSEMTAWIGSEFRIDVSNEAGTRWDQNITGFRAEEDFAFTAEPYVYTGQLIKILGL